MYYNSIQGHVRLHCQHYHIIFQDTKCKSLVRQAFKIYPQCISGGVRSCCPTETIALLYLAVVLLRICAITVLTVVLTEIVKHATGRDHGVDVVDVAVTTLHQTPPSFFQPSNRPRHSHPSPAEMAVESKLCRGNVLVFRVRGHQPW